MIDVRTLAAPDTEGRTIPKDCDVIGILIGDSNAVGWESSLTLSEERRVLPELPVKGAYMWGKWSARDVVTRYDTSGQGKWIPLSVGFGFPVGTHIGPEVSLGATRYAQLRPHAESKRTFRYGIVKVAAPGALLTPDENPRGTWDPFHLSEHSLFSTLIERHLGPAIESVQREGRRVLLDAVYVTVGSNDARPSTELGARLQAARAALHDLVDALRKANGVPDLPVVATLPLEVPEYIELRATAAMREAFMVRAGWDDDFRVVQIDDIQRQDDREHLTGLGQVGHGKRLASVWDREVTRLREPGIVDAKRAPVEEEPAA